MPHNLNRKVYFLVIFLYVVAAILAFSGCQNNSVTKQMDRNREFGYQLISSGQFDDAIAFFKGLVASDPSPENFMALSSAYVGRARVETGDYWNFIMSFRAEPEEDIRAESELARRIEEIRISFQDSLTPKQLKQLEDAQNAVFAAEKFGRRFLSIRVIEPAQLADLESAIDVLKLSKYQGARLYSAILKIIIMRTTVETGIRSWERWVEEILPIEIAKNGHSNSKRSKAINCIINLRSIIDWGKKLIYETKSIGSDLAIAFPSQEPQIISGLADLGRLEMWINQNLSQFADRSCR